MSQPAALCGVVGMKPTYGRVSRFGLAAFASSLEQIGPITGSVRENAAVLSVIAGRDSRDMKSSGRPVEDYLSQTGREVRGLRIGIPKGWLDQKELSPGIRHAVLKAAGYLEREGARMEEVVLSDPKTALGAYYVLSSAEASSNLSRYDGVRYGYRAQGAASMEEYYTRTRTEGFGEEVKRRIFLGTYVLSAGFYDRYYEKSRWVQENLRREMEACFAGVDLLLAPAAPECAFPLGRERNRIRSMLGDLYTVMPNLTGLPAMSLPFGQNAEGLPIGIQLIGPAFGEGILYRAGYVLEQGSSVKAAE